MKKPWERLREAVDIINEELTWDIEYHTQLWEMLRERILSKAVDLELKSEGREVLVSLAMNPKVNLARIRVALEFLRGELDDRS